MPNALSTMLSVILWESMTIRGVLFGGIIDGVLFFVVVFFSCEILMNSFTGSLGEDVWVFPCFSFLFFYRFVFFVFDDF